jgi:hypothetical protein
MFLSEDPIDELINPHIMRPKIKKENPFEIQFLILVPNDFSFSNIFCTLDVSISESLFSFSR